MLQAEVHAPSTHTSPAAQSSKPVVAPVAPQVQAWPAVFAPAGTQPALPLDAPLWIHEHFQPGEQPDCATGSQSGFSPTTGPFDPPPEPPQAARTATDSAANLRMAASARSRWDGASARSDA